MTRFFLNGTTKRAILFLTFLLLLKVGVAQNDIMGKVIKIPEYMGNAKKLIDKIAKSENLLFAYSSEVSLDFQVKLQQQQVKLGEFLENLFTDKPVGYKVSGTKIMLYPIKKENEESKKLIQTIRGNVIDIDSKTPLIGATIVIQGTDPQIGTITDTNGIFRLENIPVGRVTLLVSYLGYESKVIPELVVSSAKETVLGVSLKEKVISVGEAVVKAYTKKDKPLNSMSTLSARTFSVEEAQRYAGGFDDPARLASSFAGASSGNLQGNGLIIRGNAPKGLLWQLEGIEIPNPNHLPGFTTIGGGGLSALSSLMLSNSDFFTGAFPAEYGNAMSGVFDIKLRTGNNENYEHAFQAGAMGIDISSEGPFSKKKRASYLFNYRYSTLAILKGIFPDEIAPMYQDLCFKLNFPTKKSGIFSLWALATDDKFEFGPATDTSVWRNIDDQESFNVIFRMGALGLNHRYIIGTKTYINSTAAITGDYANWDEWLSDYSLIKHKMHHIDNTNYKFTFTSALNHKFSAKHNNRTGVVIDNFNYNSIFQYALVMGDELITAVKEKGSSMQYRFFSQSKINFSSKIILNVGFNAQYYNLNNEFLIEPRIGLTYNISQKQSVSMAYGNHSRLEPQFIYFARVMEGNNITYPNKKLKLTKAHHIIFAYDLSINPNLRLKIEPYYQYLYDVPVIPDSSYSTINLESEWFFSDKLSNDGTGFNYGIDLTLERFLKDGYYYLFTASLFESKYNGGDHIERNTRYNNNFVFNLLFGKEWILGTERNKILNANIRLNIMGGQWDSPVIEDYPYQLGDEVKFDYSKAFSHRKPNVYPLNVSINYRVNKKRHATIWSVQVINLLGMTEHYGYMYDFKEDKVVDREFAVIVPNLSYKIEF